MMDMVSPEDQQILNTLQEAVAEALERKQRLGQYAVVWREGRPVIIGEEVPTAPCCVPHLDSAGKEKTLGDLVDPVLED